MSLGRQRGDALKAVLWQAAKFEEHFFTPILPAMRELMPKPQSIAARFRLWWAGKKAIAAVTDKHFKYNVAAMGVDDIADSDEELAARVRRRKHFLFRTFLRLLVINIITGGVLLCIGLPIYFRFHSVFLGAAGGNFWVLA